MTASIVSSAREPFPFPVEYGKIREFAVATLSENPAHWQRDAALAQGLPEIPVTPTFPMASLLFGPPRAPDPDGLPGGVRTLYGEQEFEYRRPVFAGDVLTVRHGAVTSHERSGRRGGAMTLVVTETLYEKEGAVAIVSRGTRITTGVDVSAIVGERASARASQATLVFGDVTDDPESRACMVPRRCVSDVQEGETRVRRVDINRTHIVKYAGASGDFAPIHHDDELARQYGNPCVFAHGMLSGGIVATLASDWLGPLALRKLCMRFRARVFPGDQVTYSVRARKCAADGSVHCDLSAVNQQGEIVLSGIVEATLPLASP